MKKVEKTNEKKKADRGVRVVNILGTDYTIEEKMRKEDAGLLDADGYCDSIFKKIVVLKDADGEANDIAGLTEYKKRVLRHEAVHAALGESGINAAFLKETEELVVEWIAIQFPRLQKIFKELGAL